MSLNPVYKKPFLLRKKEDDEELRKLKIEGRKLKNRLLQLKIIRLEKELGVDHEDNIVDRPQTSF